MKRKTPTYRRKRNYVKRRRIQARKPRIPRSPTSTAVSVKRTFYSGAWQFGTAATVDFWKYFEPTIANGFNNFSDFSATFDRYKVNAVKVTFRPRFDNLAGPVTGATPMTVVKPYFCIIKDPFSITPPTGLYTSANLNTLLENGGKIYHADRAVSVYYRPYTSFPTNIGSGVTFKRTPYLRTSDTSTTFRGFHIFAYQNNFSAQTTDLIWDVFVTMYVTFKDLR